MHGLPSPNARALRRQTDTFLCLRALPDIGRWLAYRRVPSQPAEGAAASSRAIRHLRFAGRAERDGATDERVDEGRLRGCKARSRARGGQAYRRNELVALRRADVAMDHRVGRSHGLRHLHRRSAGNDPTLLRIPARNSYQRPRDRLRLLAHGASADLLGTFVSEVRRVLRARWAGRGDRAPATRVHGVGVRVLARLQTWGADPRRARVVASA